MALFNRWRLLSCEQLRTEKYTDRQTEKFGRKGKADAARNAVRPEDIVTMRQTSHSIDHLLLKVQHLLNRATAHNFFIQRQLELRSHQD